MTSDKQSIMAIPVSMDRRERVLEEIDQRIRSGIPGGYISITNTESMYHALRRPDHMAYIQGADFSLCDGVGVIAAGRFWNMRIRRYNGPVLQLDCSAYGQSRGWRHYYFGGKAGVADLMARKLKERFVGLNVVGTYSPPFGDWAVEEDEAIVQQINDAKPDILWVGLGLIKQEAWIARHLHRINVPWMIGVGAAFDYHSGAVPWAPQWMRAMGLEWLFRLIIQPRLRARRYWWSFLFVIEASLSGLRRKVRVAHTE